ncbi:MAG: methylcobamide--CoM methyltransferase [Firmicutes bacterium]|nr:methylcobamide--CoM methyltransferase [Bacillota bacterium]
MSWLTPKERLLGALQKRKIDRPPVICTGGMMNAAIVEIMNQTGHTLPEAHHDAELMAELAYDVHENTGFENFGIPFCMTVEAEALGSEINYGTLSCEPKIEKELYASVAEVRLDGIKQLEKIERINTITQAGHLLAQAYPEVPVIGNLTGPISTTASIVDPITFLKELRKDKPNAHRVIDHVSEHLIEYARLMVESGVTLISIGDPTATGEILGPKMFEEYAVRYLNQVIDRVHSFGVPVIVHICGNMNTVKHLIPSIKSDAISTDALVNLRLLKEEFPQLTTMGNLSTYLLEFGTADKVARQTETLVRDGVDIISPACGLSTSTSLENIRAMTRVVKEG